MLSQSDFVRKSLDTNLFFARIMREHATFIAASLPCKETNLLQQSYYFINSYNGLLCEILNLANNQVSQKYVTNEVFVTDKTIVSEKKVQALTGIPIDSNITQSETLLNGTTAASPALTNSVYNLNQKAMWQVSSLIQFKGNLLQLVSSCNLFTWAFPSMIEHIRNEAMLYHTMLQRLQNGLDPIDENLTSQIESFWDRIMEEHAEVIRNYLDPSEKKLFQKADSFAEEFNRLTKETRAADDNLPALEAMTKINQEATVAIKDFKEEGTELILACKIKSLINPLLADHTVREANYYILVLEELKSKLNT